MNKKNLFILRSPLQIINAIEAIEHFNLKNNILVLIYNSLDSNTKQIKELVSSYEWEDIIELKDKSKSKLLLYISLIKELNKYEFNYLIFGNLGTIQKILIANLKKDHVYMLDDGTSTVMYYDNYIKVSRINKYNFRELRFLFFGRRVKIRDTINLFTYFNLKPIDNIKIIKNDLLYLKKNDLSKSKKSNKVYFIGQPLDDVKVLSVENYIKALENLSKMYKTKITYIPHRAESNNLKKHIDLIDSKYIEILKISIPIEIYFLKEKIEPTVVFSYFSTALSTLKIIFKDMDVKILKIPLEYIENKKYYYEFLKKYYSSIDESNIINFYDLDISHKKKILVIRNMKIGDMVVATGFFHLIKKHVPNVAIDVLASEKSNFLLKYSKDVENVYTHYKNTKLKTFLELLKIRKNNYDLVIDLSHVNLFRSSLWKIILGAKKYIGFSKYRKYIIPQEKIYDEVIKFNKYDLMVNNIYKFLPYIQKNIEPKVFYHLDNSDEIEAKAINFYKLFKKNKIIFINISASGPQRNINEELFKQIVLGIKRVNANAQVIIGYTSCDLNRARGFKNFFKDNSVVLSYVTRTIFDTYALVKYADLVITPDTSVVHIASAYDKPLIAFYSSDKINYAQWKPLASKNLCIFSKGLTSLDDIDFSKANDFLLDNISEVKDD